MLGIKTPFIFKEQKILFLLFFVAMFLATQNGFTTVLSLFCIWILIKVPVLKYFDGSAVALLFFSIMYVAFGMFNGAISGLSSALVYGLPWFFFYVFGRYVAENSEGGDLMTFIAFTLLTSSIVIDATILWNIIEKGTLIDTTRSFSLMGNTSIEDADIINSTTILSTLAATNVGIASLFIIKDKSIPKYVLLILCLLTILGSVHTITRGPIAVCAISTVLILLFYYRDNISKVVLYLLLIGIVAFIVLSYFNVLGDITIAFEGRNEDGTLRTAGNRTQRWSSAIGQLFVSPFGWWNQSNSSYYIHNMWLDVAKISGIVPFIILVVETIKSFVMNFKCAKGGKDDIAYLLLGINLCLCISSFQEPTISGIVPCLIALFWGLGKQYQCRSYSGILN